MAIAAPCLSVTLHVEGQDTAAGCTPWKWGARLAIEDCLRALQALLQQLKRREALLARKALAKFGARLAAVRLRGAAELAHQPDPLPPRQACAQQALLLGMGR